MNRFHLPLKLGWLLPAIMLIGCSNEEDLPLAHQSQGDTGISRALEIANEFFDQIEPGTRSSNRTPASIQRLETSQTRSGENEVDIRLINYSNNQGFALMDVQPGQETIFAISPYGQLQFTDTIGNPVLKEFCDGIVEYANELSSQTTASSPWMPERRYYSIKEHCKLTLNSWASSWSEIADENSIYIGFVKYRAGTASVAVAKILSYFQYPEKIYDPSTGNYFQFGWYTLLTAQLDDIKNTLIYHLNAHDIYLNSTFNAIYTDTDPANINQTFRHLNYAMLGTNGEKYSSKADRVKEYLRNGYGIYKKGPVIGYAQQTGTQIYDALNQYWVIDGFADREYYLLDANGKILFDTPYTAPTLLHCIWGDGKTPEGYYAYVTNSEILEKNMYEYKKNNSRYGFVDSGKTVEYTFKNLKIFGGFYF